MILSKPNILQMIKNEAALHIRVRKQDRAIWRNSTPGSLTESRRSLKAIHAQSDKQRTNPFVRLSSENPETAADWLAANWTGGQSRSTVAAGLQ